MTALSLKRVPLLDAMNVADVKRYRKSIKRRGRHYGPVRRYCDGKIKAMTFRLAGDCNRAMRYERHCDEIYRKQLQGKVDW
jgi:hypothetical protein